METLKKFLEDNEFCTIPASAHFVFSHYVGIYDRNTSKGTEYCVVITKKTYSNVLNEPDTVTMDAFHSQEIWKYGIFPHLTEAFSVAREFAADAINM